MYQNIFKSVYIQSNKMGCINSVPNTKEFSVINNKSFNDDDDNHNDNFIGGIIYIKNIEWCLKASKYIERLCFILASYHPDKMTNVKSMVSRIASSKVARTPVGKEFIELTQYIDDVAQFYLICMQCIRRHAANNTTLMFNDIARYIKTSILYSSIY